MAAVHDNCYSAHQPRCFCIGSHVGDVTVRVARGLEPEQVSQEMWSWINLTLEKSASAQRTLHNVPVLNGAELYRRLVAPLGQVQPSVQRKNALRDKVQAPARAKSMTTIMDAVAVYEADMIDFLKAGGVEPSAAWKHWTSPMPSRLRPS